MSAVAARARSRPAALVIVAVAAAAAVRGTVGAPSPASSIPGALLFSGILAGIVVIASAPGSVRPTWAGTGFGIGGGAALVAVSFVGLPAITVGLRAAPATLAWWVPLVTVVAASEELVLRGVLFSWLRSDHGDAAAVLVTAALFAAIHLPLYGLGAMPIDLGVGVFLGLLRVASGGVSAPLLAHVIADLATGWLH